ncbi:MAG TPA: hypothetical protein PKL29_00425, partial [Methanothrix sp.]|nr:hypothetical protein [Methanothrix sp.]
MKYIQFLIALVAVSMFVFPAVSMPDTGRAIDSNDQQLEQAAGSQTCDCPNAVEGFGHSKMPVSCDKKAPQGPAENMAPRSMMGGKMSAPCEPKAPQGVENFAPKSMMDGKEAGPCGGEQNAGEQKNAFGPS